MKNLLGFALIPNMLYMGLALVDFFVASPVFHDSGSLSGITAMALLDKAYISGISGQG